MCITAGHDIKYENIPSWNNIAIDITVRSRCLQSVSVRYRNKESTEIQLMIIIPSVNALIWCLDIYVPAFIQAS